MKKATLLHYSFVIITFLLLSLTGWGQRRKVSGIVQESENNSSLEGATVSLKNKNSSTLTGVDGKFIITVPNGKVSLIVSFVGYQTKTIVVGEGETSVLITLSQSKTNQLSDIVVVGYTSKQLSNISGSVSVVSGEQLNDVTSNNVTSLLQEKVAGVIVSNGSDLLHSRI